jgi:DNA-binding transcriptional LysR family regulator
MSAFDVRHLRAFVAVAEEQHFSRAAKRLHMAQPPLSQLIRSLEKSLQTQLFARTTRSVTLTVAGEVLLERARHILSAVEDAVVDVHRAERGELGRVRLGFTDLCAVDLLPLLAQQFQHQHPTVHLDLRGSYNSYEEIDLLLADELDAGIIHGRITHPTLSSRPLRIDRMVVALPSDHRLVSAETIDLAALADDPFVMYPESRGSAIRENVIASCAAADFRPQTIREVQDSMAIVAVVAAGVGVAVLPSSFMEFQPPGCTYRPLAGHGHELALTLVWRSGDDSSVLQRFLEVAAELATTNHSMLDGTAYANDQCS